MKKFRNVILIVVLVLDLGIMGFLSNNFPHGSGDDAYAQELEIDDSASGSEVTDAAAVQESFSGFEMPGENSEVKLLDYLSVSDNAGEADTLENQPILVLSENKVVPAAESIAGIDIRNDLAQKEEGLEEKGFINETLKDSAKDKNPVKAENEKAEMAETGKVKVKTKEAEAETEKIGSETVAVETAGKMEVGAKNASKQDDLDKRMGENPSVRKEEAVSGNLAGQNHPGKDGNSGKDSSLEAKADIGVSVNDADGALADVPMYTSKNYPIEQIDGITYIDGIMVVNKSYSLPPTYNPGGLLPEVKQAFSDMQADAAKEGLRIKISSGFRTYKRQANLYNYYTRRDGQEGADRFSARPGYSEHQTGLCIDLNSICDAFNVTKEAQWVGEHAHEYGFIVRFPQGKEDVTGYKYESWHLRYIGVEKATEVYESGLCLEEFLGISSAYVD